MQKGQKGKRRESEWVEGVDAGGVAEGSHIGRSKVRLPLQAGEDGRGFRKRCCHSQSGSPVIPPPDNIRGDQLGKVRQSAYIKTT